MREETLHQAHLAFIPTAHSHKAGDHPPQLYPAIQFLTEKKISFLAGGFSELLVTLSTPKHAPSKASAIPRHLPTISSQRAEEGYLV